MQHSAEVRWFYQESLSEDVISWFQKQPSEGVREDRYLLLTGCESVGVKIRGGGEKNLFEVKALRGAAETMQLPGGVSGRTDCWVKWSVGEPAINSWLDSLQKESEGWVVVQKERWLRKYSLDRSPLIEVCVSDRPSEGCNVELTRLVVGEQQWWSFAFEAFGTAEQVRENLRMAASHFFSHHSPVTSFHVANSCSYPAWLASFPTKI